METNFSIKLKNSLLIPNIVLLSNLMKLSKNNICLIKTANRTN